MADEEATEWFWCLRHQRPEPAATVCSAELRMGPYASEEAARRYAQTAEARNETWDAEDERWEGP